jgi:SpoIID/LytB domain protein
MRETGQQVLVRPASRRTSLAVLGAALALWSPLLAPAAHALGPEDAAPGAAAPLLARGGVRVTADPDQLVALGGIATARRFLDTIELLPRRDGIDVVNELSFDAYLYGLAEVPQSWPEAVLDAQVIAARSYAWHVMGLATSADYDICATVACQVFRGAEVLLAPNGERWRDAVDRTSGQVLLSGGEPILARYFSTSGGRTYANEFVFPSSGPRPYLVGIEDPYDALAPLHRWEVRFTHDEFNTILAAGQTLRRTVPFATVERLGADDDPRAEIRVIGRDGSSVQVRAIVLRDFLSTRAPELFPDRFPPLRADGERPLPSTVPTTRYGVAVTADEVVLTGLGWGHGVGMGQWGAHARALEGQSAEDILAAYYNGLRPTTTARLPDRIRAGMGAARLDDAGRMELRLLVPTTIRDLDGRPLATSLGTWHVSRTTDARGRVTGNDLELVPPPGEGEVLELSSTTFFPAPYWGPGATLGSIHPGDSDASDLWITVNKPVQLRLEVREPNGRRVLERDLGVAERGVHGIRWFHDDADGDRVAPGRYVVRLVGSDQNGDVKGRAARTLVVR